MRRWAQRKPAGFNLAFLDIMACGLGAIILIFMLVKYQTESPATEVNAASAQLASLTDEIETIQSNNSALVAQSTALKQKLQQQTQSALQQDKARGATAQALIQLSKEIAQLEQKLAQQKQDAEQAQESSSADKPKTNEQHLLGLRVSGKRILILLDNSASMADERLVDIIKIKVSDTAAKKSAPKWRRAVAVAQWIVERIPERSEYMLITYNERADFLLDKKWLKASDANAQASVLQALQQHYPHSATNLHSALQLIKTNALAPTDIYIITDSLPTKGVQHLPTVRRLLECGVRASKKTTISGSCREALFYSVARSFSTLSATINTVLLPIEGDPDAPYAYWRWSASTTGTMVSPAGTWP